MKINKDSLIRVMSILFFTFGITYLDFDELGSAGNIRPYIMLALGIVTILYSFATRSKSEDK